MTRETRQRNRKLVESLLSNEDLTIDARIAILSTATDEGVYSEHEYGERLSTLTRMKKARREQDEP